eukprot:4032920-Amphidinium_carterae.1
MAEGGPRRNGLAPILRFALAQSVRVETPFQASCGCRAWMVRRVGRHTRPWAQSSERSRCVIDVACLRRHVWVTTQHWLLSSRGHRTIDEMFGSVTTSTEDLLGLVATLHGSLKETKEVTHAEHVHTRSPFGGVPRVDKQPHHVSLACRSLHPTRAHGDRSSRPETQHPAHELVTLHPYALWASQQEALRFIFPVQVHWQADEFIAKFAELLHGVEKTVRDDVSQQRCLLISLKDLNMRNSRVL